MTRYTRFTRVIVLADAVTPDAVNRALGHASTHEIVVFEADARRYAQLDAWFGAHSRVTLVPLAIGDERASRIKKAIRRAESLRASEARCSFVIATGATGAYMKWLTPFVRSVARFDHPLAIYDLGNLGFGFPLEQKTLDRRGFYKELRGGWRSKALHKPALVADCLERYDAFTVYIDADSVLLDPLSDIEGDYDVGVTVRARGELVRSTKTTFAYAGFVNAGVAFFAPTRAARAFVERWKKLTRNYENDQRALNALVNPSAEPLEIGQTLVRDGVRIRTFPGAVYNKSCTSPHQIDATTKIAHFRSHEQTRVELPAELARISEAWAPPVERKVAMLAAIADVPPPAIEVAYESVARATASRWSRMYYWERAKADASTTKLVDVERRFSNVMTKRAELIAIVDGVRARERDPNPMTASDIFDRHYWECDAMRLRKRARVLDLEAGTGGLLWCAREVWDCEVSGLALHRSKTWWKAFGLEHAIRLVKTTVASPAFTLPKERFDCIVAPACRFGVEWSGAEWLAFLRAAARALKPRGVIHLRFVELPRPSATELFRALFHWSPTPTDALLRVARGDLRFS